LWPVHFRNLRSAQQSWHCHPQSGMITMRGSGWPFYFSLAFRSAPPLVLEALTLKLRDLQGNPGLRLFGTVCAFALVCSLGANAAVQVTGDPPSKTSHQTVSPKKHVRSAAKASGAPVHHKAHPASHPAAGSHPKSGVAHATHPPTTKHASSRKRKKTARGQKKIDSDRAEEIQEALIREHYLTGDASGKWDQVSEDAMRRYQADHGWQTKTVPDSRALISLGLGPSHDHLLNPESAMTTGPGSLRPASEKPVAAQVPPAPHIVATPAPSPTPAPHPAADSGTDQSGPQ